MKDEYIMIGSGDNRQLLNRKSGDVLVTGSFHDISDYLENLYKGKSILFDVLTYQGDDRSVYCHNK